MRVTLFTLVLCAAALSSAPTAAAERCQAYADLVHRTCGFDREASADQCLLFQRMGKAAKCEATVDAALRCTEKTAQKRETKSGTACNSKECDALDLQLEKCLKAYCATKPKDQDCSVLFPAR